jgi:hypothetical protein
MAAFTFNQADGTDLEDISPLWAGDVPDLLEVQSSKLQAVGAGIFAQTTAFLNEAGSSFAVAKYSPLQAGQCHTFIRSSTGAHTAGYSFAADATSGNLFRNGVNVGTFAFTGGHNASTTATEIRIEQVGSDVNVYAGPVGSAVQIGTTYTDPSPLSGGFSGFKMTGGGTATPSITAFDNGVIAYTYARPSSDITKQWTPSSGSDHFAMIDEVTASDSDYISATAAGQTTEVKLAAMTQPQAGTSVAIGYRVQGITGAAGVTVSMVQGTTVIATDTNRTANGDYVLTVAPATWASVTDWTDIRLRFVST